MTTRKHGVRTWLWVGGLFLACSERPHEHTTATAPAGSAPGRRQVEEPVDHHDHDHGDHAHHEPGAEDEHGADLERPVEELLRQRCEHAKPTYTCDECRYEVGFVRAPAALFEEGLMSRVQVRPSRIEATLRLLGELRFDERRVARVSPQVNGLIRRVPVSLGDTVRRGQPLLELESVAIGQDQAELAEAGRVLEAARRNRERLALLGAEKIVSEREVLEATRELELAELRQVAVKKRLARLGSGEAEDGRMVLTAPRAGQVLSLSSVTGEVARAEEVQMTIGDPSQLVVWADVHERELGAVRSAAERGKLAVSVEVKAYPGEEFQGEVELVSPAMDELSRTAKVRIAVQNPEQRLLSGMFATVRVPVPGHTEALVVPKGAVLTDEGKTFVFVHVEGDDFVRRPVTLGRSDGRLVAVLSGLAAGQEVVDDGAFLLKSDVLRSKMGAGCAD